MTIAARPADAGARTIARPRAVRPTRALLGAAAGASLALAAVATVLAAYADRALPNVTVAGVAVGSLDRAALRERLAREVAPPWAHATVEVTLAGRSWRSTNGALGVEPDLEAATGAALAYGKTGGPLERAAAWGAALTRGADVPFRMRASGGALDAWLAAIADDARVAPVDGAIGLGASGFTLTEPVVGRELDRGHAAAAILGAAGPGDRVVELRARPLHPAVDEAGYAAAAALVRAATAPFEVAAHGRTVREDATGLAALLRVERVAAKDGDLPALPPGAVAPPARYRYEAALDEARVRSWAGAVAAALDRPARSAGYAFAPDGSLRVVPGDVGVKVDQEAFVRAALGALTSPSGRSLVPPLVADQPAFTTEQAERFASQMTRVVAFETFFPPNLARWKNISTGAAQFNGTVVAPGETFSFWRALGPVTVERGYAYAGAIIDGRSNENVIGGGLCQVSTTLFYAVASAGYEIVERGSHDYYIDRYPLGLDAAVFDPGLDLRWRNDTPFPVLIRTSWSDIAVEFELFTVPTGRATVFSGPLESNWRDVAAGQAADPAFPPGAKVLGRDVVRYRTVTDASGAIVHRDTFVSRYRPVWGGPAAQ